MALETATSTDRPASLREVLEVVGALFAGVCLLFGRVLFLDAALVGRDIQHHYWPLHAAAARALSQGRLPEWDPTSQGGVPLLANIHAGIFYPPNLLYQVLDFPRAYAWLVAGHLVLLGVGAWALTRRWFGHGPAVVGALALALSGPVLSLNVFGPNLAALAWLPWVLWALARGGPTARTVAWCAPFLSLQVLAGDPMPALFTGITGALFVAIVDRRYKLLLTLAAAGAVALLVAAVQVLPTLELLKVSDRASGVGDEMWSLHPARLWELLVPRVFGQYLDQPPFWGLFLSNGPVRIPFLLSGYLGAASATLALAGARRTRLVAFAATLFAVGILLALGERFIGGGLLRLPPFSLFRYPEKYLVLSALGFSVLVASGAAKLRAHGSAWPALLPVGVGLSTWLVAGPLRPVFDLLFEGLSKRQGSRFRLDAAAETVSSAGWVALLPALVVFALVLLRQRVSEGRLLTLVAVTVALDLVQSAEGVIWTGPRELFLTVPPLVAQLQSSSPQHPFRIWRDNARLERNIQKEGTYAALADRRAFDGATLKTAIGTVWGIEDVSAASPVILKRWTNFMTRVGPDAPRALALLNACFAIVPESMGPWLKLGSQPELALGNGAAVFRFPGCMPRVWSPREWVWAPTEAEVLDRVAAPAFDVTVGAAVEGPEGRPSSGPVELDGVEIGPDGSVGVDVRAPPQGGLVVYSAAFNPGWQAGVDGAPTEVVAVNGMLMGAFVGAGAHHLTFRYLTPKLTVGAVLTLAGLLLLAALARRKPSDANGQVKSAG